MASDLLATIRGEIEARLDALRPLLSEYERLLAAADALATPDVVAPSTPPEALVGPAVAPEPVAPDEPVAGASLDVAAVAAASDDVATDAPEDVFATDAPRDSAAVASSGNGTAAASYADGAGTASFGGATAETIADAPWTGRHGLGGPGTAVGETALEASEAVPSDAVLTEDLAPTDDPPKPQRVDGPSARQAILAALGHGSHTLGELVMVTAMTTSDIRGNLGRLVAWGAVTKTKRDGKTAYALASPSAETAA